MKWVIALPGSLIWIVRLIPRSEDVYKRQVQTMRKEADFEVMDKIAITYEGTEKAEAVFADHVSEIGEETLAVSVEKKSPIGYVKEWKINGENVTLGVEKQ